MSARFASSLTIAIESGVTAPTGSAATRKRSSNAAESNARLMREPIANVFARKAPDER
ncbi:MAG TPA: hypothetical protein VJR91_13455 [Burkholderia sp.]|nr:hypothetical protein [Burkholderia sp.]